MNTSTMLLVTTYLDPRRYDALATRTRRLKLRMLLRVRDPSRLSCVGGRISVINIGGHGLNSFIASMRGSFQVTQRLHRTARKPTSPLLISRDNVSSPRAVYHLHTTNFHNFLVNRAFVGATGPNRALGRFVRSDLLVSGWGLGISGYGCGDLSCDIASHDRVMGDGLWVMGGVSPLVGMYKVARTRGVHGMRLRNMSVVNFVFCPGSPHYLYRVPKCLPTYTGHINIFIGRDGRGVLVCASHFDLSCVRLRNGRTPRCYHSLRGTNLRLVGTFSVLLPGSLLSISTCGNLYSCCLFSAGAPRCNNSNGRFS